MARSVDFAKKELENPNKDVRESAHNLILHFMKAVGTEKIEPMLDGKFQPIICSPNKKIDPFLIF